MSVLVGVPQQTASTSMVCHSPLNISYDYCTRIMGLLKETELTRVNANVVGHFRKSKESPNPEVTSQHQDDQGAPLDDVADAADNLHLAPLLIVGFDPPFCLAN